MAKKEASDLHLKPMRPPLLRIKGRLIPLNADALQPKDLEEMLTSILTPAQKERLEAHQSVDVGYGLTGVARFRCNIFVQRGSYAAVFRRIPFKLPSITELNLPGGARELRPPAEGPRSDHRDRRGRASPRRWPGSCARSSRSGPVHIVTIEDPIEFLFADGKAAVSQREVSTDSPSFNEALKNMFRQDPDVIMVGEMRDWNTMQTAITAAETGHLVFSTLHTNSAAQSIDRIIDSCPIEQQAQVRSQLSIVLQAIVSMNLIETSDGTGRSPVVEIMVNSPKIAKHILSGEVKEIHEEIENSVNYYKMQSMNQSLIALLVNRRITYAEGDGALDGSRGPVPEAPQALPPDRGKPARRPHGVRQRFLADHAASRDQAALRGAGREVEAAPLREGRGSQQVHDGAARPAARHRGPRPGPDRHGEPRTPGSRPTPSGSTASSSRRSPS